MGHLGVVPFDGPAPAGRGRELEREQRGHDHDTTRRPPVTGDLGFDLLLGFHLRQGTTVGAVR
jgi:hypothetical protein